MTARLIAILTSLALGFSVCAGQAAAQTFAPTEAALPAARVEAALEDYRIGPFDKLTINVFQVKDLTLDEVQVDASGQILLPLIGQVAAGGKSTRELSKEIAGKLAERYLQNPQVSVLVKEAASQKVAVEGAVMEAGVFQLKGRTSLLQAVAMAKGPHPNADLKRVAVFRDVDGQRMAAVFNLKAIRKGKAEDPQILGNDVVVVNSSALKGGIRELVRSLPALGIFAVF
ncbi:MAG TPA: polysaccharide biosynthesis/export family protein [Phenylobacterium sp.]|nr:polysaccharide biosynthesis/export family protein [Phenylobacterium sp.]